MKAASQKSSPNVREDRQSCRHPIPADHHLLDREQKRPEQPSPR